MSRACRNQSPGESRSNASAAAGAVD